jgi:hypothetical protein
MWVEGGDIHDELLDQLGGVLAPPQELALAPSAAELEALAAAVAARWPGGAAAPTGIGSGDAVVAESAPALDPSGAETGGEVRPRWGGPRARRLGSSAWRAGSVAAGIVLFSASAAAAANGGVPLPRPMRVVAYTVGLPVDSPALDDTHQHIKELKEAVKAKDTPKAEATVRRLRTDLAKVPADEKKEAKPKIEAAIGAAEGAGVIQSPAPTTTTTAPPATSTTVTGPASSTTATTAEEQEREKDRSTVTTTTAPSTTTTTAPESTTTTTAPETDGTAPGGTTGDPGTGDGQSGAGGGGDPGTTPTTVPEETTTTTTTAPPPDETTTTTTTAPEPVTTTTTTQPATSP